LLAAGKDLLVPFHLSGALIGNHNRAIRADVRLTVSSALFMDRKVLVAVMDKRVEQLADGARRF
jgi:hypothetical protein